MCLGCGMPTVTERALAGFAGPSRPYQQTRFCIRPWAAKSFQPNLWRRWSLKKKALAFEQKVTARSRIVFDGEASLWGTGFVMQYVS